MDFSWHLENIAVLGLGKVGTLAPKFLYESGFKVSGYDVHTPSETPILRARMGLWMNSARWRPSCPVFLII